MPTRRLDKPPLPFLQRGHRSNGGVVGCYAFGERNGTTARDLAAGPVGSGAVQGSAPYPWMTGGGGPGLAFSAAGPATQYVVVPDRTALRFAGPFSVEAVVRLRTNPAIAAGICGKAASVWTNASFACRFTTAGSVSFVTTTNGSDATELLTGNIFDTEWHHLGFVWDGGNRRIYRDGVQKATDVYAGPVYTGSTANLALGVYDLSSRLSGDMDITLVRFYNRAVPASEWAVLAADPYATVRPISRAGLLSAAAVSPALGAGALASVATLTGAGRLDLYGAGSPAAVSTLSGAGLLSLRGAADLGAVATLAGAGRLDLHGAGALASVATLTGTPALPRLRFGDFDGAPYDSDSDPWGIDPDATLGVA